MSKRKTSKSRFPRGWDERKVKSVLRHYENQTPEEAVVEDEAAFGRPSHTLMKVPARLVPAIRRLIATHNR